MTFTQNVMRAAAATGTGIDSIVPNEIDLLLATRKPRAVIGAPTVSIECY